MMIMMIIICNHKMIISNHGSQLNQIGLPAAAAIARRSHGI